MLVRRAAPPDRERLREVMAAAKAHWGYDPDLVADWAAGEDFTDTRFSGREIYADEGPWGRPLAVMRLELA